MLFYRIGPFSGGGPDKTAILDFQHVSRGAGEWRVCELRLVGGAECKVPSSCLTSAPFRDPEQLESLLQCVV